MAAPDTGEKRTGSVAAWLAVYTFILGIALLQIVIAYQNVEAWQRFLRMFMLVIVQAAAAILFFMRVKSEKRALAFFLLPATVFVLAMMNMFWSDSFRLLNMRPFAR